VRAYDAGGGGLRWLMPTVRAGVYANAMDGKSTQFLKALAAALTRDLELVKSIK
jgi:hypothetical protein